MKKIRFLVVVAAVLRRRGLFAMTICFLLLRATCNAGDPKSKSVDVDLHQNKAVSNRTLHVRPLTAVPFTRSSPSNFRNQGPAIIGGPADKLKNATAINGTGMKRKP
jgi:hypothetical protein